MRAEDPLNLNDIGSLSKVPAEEWRREVVGIVPAFI